MQSLSEYLARKPQQPTQSATLNVRNVILAFCTFAESANVRSRTDMFFTRYNTYELAINHFIPRVGEDGKYMKQKRFEHGQLIDQLNCHIETSSRFKIRLRNALKTILFTIPKVDTQKGIKQTMRELLTPETTEIIRYSLLEYPFADMETRERLKSKMLSALDRNDVIKIRKERARANHPFR